MQLLRHTKASDLVDVSCSPTNVAQTDFFFLKQECLPVKLYNQ